MSVFVDVYRHQFENGYLLSSLINLFIMQSEL